MIFFNTKTFRKSMNLALLVFLVILSSCHSDRQKAETKFNVGVSFYKNTEFANAIPSLQEAIRIDNSFSNAKFLLAECFVKQENYDGSIDVLSSINNEEVSISSIDSLFTIIYLKKQDWDMSLDYANRLIANNSNSFQGHLFKGKSLYNKGFQLDDILLYKSALKSVTVANKIKPNNSSVLMLRGVIRFGVKDFQGAIKDLKLVIRQEKKDNLTLGTAYLFVGMSLQNSHKLKEALSYYDNALNYLPNSGQAYLNRGLLKVDLKIVDSACDDFRKALELGQATAVDAIQTFCSGS